MAGPDITFRYIDGDLYKDEIGKFNYRFGLNYTFQISNRIVLEVGARYASIGYQTAKMDIQWGSEHNGNGGYEPDPNLPHNFRNSSDYRFIEFPLSAKYILKKGKFTPYIAAGISPNVYLNTRSVTIIEAKTEISVSKTHNINKLNLSAHAGFGIDYQLNKSLEIYMQPSFRYYLKSISSGPIKEYLYSAGIELGIRKQFR
ncbi:hypothetical protein MASR1M65_26030 [Saprospiraceae bacterium]